MSSLLLNHPDSYINIGTAIEWRTILKNHATSLWVRTTVQSPMCLVSLSNETYEVFSISMNVESGKNSTEGSGGLSVHIEDIGGHKLEAYTPVPPLADGRWHLVEVAVTTPTNVPEPAFKAQYNTAGGRQSIFCGSDVGTNPDSGENTTRTTTIGTGPRGSIIPPMLRLSSLCESSDSGSVISGKGTAFSEILSTVTFRVDGRILTTIYTLREPLGIFRTAKVRERPLYPANDLLAARNKGRKIVDNFRGYLSDVYVSRGGFGGEKLHWWIVDMQAGRTVWDRGECITAAVQASGKEHSAGLHLHCCDCKWDIHSFPSVALHLHGTEGFACRAKNITRTLLAQMFVARPLLPGVLGFVAPAPRHSFDLDNDEVALTLPAHFITTPKGGAGSVFNPPLPSPAHSQQMGGSMSAANTSLTPPGGLGSSSTPSAANIPGGKTPKHSISPRFRTPSSVSSTGNAFDKALYSKRVGFTIWILCASPEPAVVLYIPFPQHDMCLVLNHEGKENLALLVGTKAYVANVNVCDNEWRQISWVVDPGTGVSCFLDGQLTTWEQTSVNVETPSSSALFSGRGSSEDGPDSGRPSDTKPDSAQALNPTVSFPEPSVGIAGEPSVLSPKEDGAFQAQATKRWSTMIEENQKIFEGYDLQAALATRRRQSRLAFISALRPTARKRSPSDQQRLSQQRESTSTGQFAGSVNPEQQQKKSSVLPFATFNESFATDPRGSLQDDTCLVMGHYYRGSVRDFKLVVGQTELYWPLDQGRGMHVPVHEDASVIEFSIGVDPQTASSALMTSYLYGSAATLLQCPTAEQANYLAIEATGRFAMWPKHLYPKCCIQFDPAVSVPLCNVVTQLERPFGLSFFVRLTLVDGKAQYGQLIAVEGTVIVECMAEKIQVTLPTSLDTAVVPPDSSPHSPRLSFVEDAVTLPCDRLNESSGNTSEATAGEPVPPTDLSDPIGALLCSSLLLEDGKWHFMDLLIPSVGSSKGVTLAIDGTPVDLHPLRFRVTDNLDDRSSTSATTTPRHLQDETAERKAELPLDFSSLRTPRTSEFEKLRNEAQRTSVGSATGSDSTEIKSVNLGGSIITAPDFLATSLTTVSIPGQEAPHPMSGRGTTDFVVATPTASTQKKNRLLMTPRHWSIKCSVLDRRRFGQHKEQDDAEEKGETVPPQEEYVPAILARARLERQLEDARRLQQKEHGEQGEHPIATLDRDLGTSPRRHDGVKPTASPPPKTPSTNALRTSGSESTAADRVTPKGDALPADITQRRALAGLKKVMRSLVHLGNGFRGSFANVSLKPTANLRERMFWPLDDGSTLKLVRIPFLHDSRFENYDQNYHFRDDFPAKSPTNATKGQSKFERKLPLLHPARYNAETHVKPINGGCLLALGRTGGGGRGGGGVPPNHLVVTVTLLQEGRVKAQVHLHAVLQEAEVAHVHGADGKGALLVLG